MGREREGFRIVWGRERVFLKGEEEEEGRRGRKRA